MSYTANGAGGSRPPPAGSAGTLTLGGELTVNRLGFGAMRLTGEGIWGNPVDPAECRAVLRGAIEWGVNLIDTADSYGPEVSERLISQTLRPYPPTLSSRRRAVRCARPRKVEVERPA